MLKAIIVGVFHIKHMFSLYASYQYNTVVSNPCPGGGGGGSFYVVPNLYVINVCCIKKNNLLSTISQEQVLCIKPSVGTAE